MLCARVTACSARAFSSSSMYAHDDGRARLAAVVGDVAHVTRQRNRMPRIVVELTMIENARAFRKPAY